MTSFGWAGRAGITGQLFVLTGMIRITCIVACSVMAVKNYLQIKGVFSVSVRTLRRNVTFQCGVFGRFCGDAKNNYGKMCVYMKHLLQLL